MRGKTILLIFVTMALVPLAYISAELYLDYTFDQKCNSDKIIIVHDELSYSLLLKYAKEEIPKDKHFLWRNSEYKLNTIESSNDYGLIEQSVTYSIKKNNIVTIKNYKIIMPNLFDSSGSGSRKRECYDERNSEYPEYLSFY